MQTFLGNRNRLNRQGFTLVELLIVIIILAVLAAIVVPQFGSSTEDANVSTLKADLSAMRNAVEMYYQQHNSRYPGKYLETDGTTLNALGLSGTAGTAGNAFVAQMTQYSDKNGKVSGVKDAVFKYGPYIKGKKLPANPFSAAAADVIYADVAESSTENEFEIPGKQRPASPCQTAFYDPDNSRLKR